MSEISVNIPLEFNEVAVPRQQRYIADETEYV